MWCHTLLLEELTASRVTPLGENSYKLAPGFLWTLPHASFPFADFAFII